MKSKEKTAVENLEHEVKKIEKKLSLLTREDKAGRMFLIIGVLLISVSMLGLGFAYWQESASYINFLLGFLLIEIMMTGYALAHKSLSGDWL